MSGRGPSITTGGRLEEKSHEVEAKLLAAMDAGKALSIVKAPPGSGKTHLLVEAVARAAGMGRRVAVATPTRPQAAEICERLRERFPEVPVLRFLSTSDTADPGWVYPATSWKNDLRSLTRGVVVATASKWSFVDMTGQEPFDHLVVEEAWQVGLARFIALCPVAERFVLVGDPGQIDPVVSLDTSRWVTSPAPPHQPAPEAVLKNVVAHREEVLLELPATRRLPPDSAGLVRSFYDFDFEAVAREGERKLEWRRSPPRRARRLWEALDRGSVAALAIDRSAGGGPSPEGDRRLAEEAGRIVVDLLRARPICRLGAGEKDRMLEPGDIGMAATHRTMVQELSLRLPAAFREAIRVDTPERWQGLERPVMLIVHPLSSVGRPSEFDLGTGRLCVMASRHQVKLIVLTRDDVPETLEEYSPPGDQPIGWEDEAGKGHAAHQKFLRELQAREMWVKSA